jgi:anti-sigma factor RsiW
MNDINVCGNHEALIGYLYDECEPAERGAVAAHVALCASCADEIRALGDTRAHLVSWAAPALPLGFQLTRTESDTPASGTPARVLRPAAWWSQPLPAWAQAAAAVVIFAAGMSVNIVRSSGEAPAVVAQAPAPQPVAARTSVDDLAVTRAEFARLAERLRAIEHADVQLASRTGREIDQDDLFARIAALEQRTVENDRRTMGLISTLTTLAREAENQREATRTVNAMREDVRELGYAFRTVAPQLAVRTALTSGRER